MTVDNREAELNKLSSTWNQFGKDDPLWSILGADGKRNNNWDVEDFFKTGDSEVEEVMSCLRTNANELDLGKALDFGCGVGRCTQAFARFFSGCVGVDIAPSMINLAEKFNPYPDSVSYVTNGVDDLSQFADDEFDFVYSARVLQHMPPSISMRYIEEFLIYRRVF